MTTSGSIDNTLGFALFVAGLPPLALGLGWLIVPAQEFPVPLWALGCGGTALTLAGVSLLVPVSLARLRGLLAVLAISTLALLFDWTAFGRVQGGWRFMLDTLVNALALRQNAALDVVVLFAVLLTLLALLSWINLARNLTGRSSALPLKNAGRKRKLRDASLTD